MEFGEKLQALRKSKGMTQEELAAALFVSRTAVSKWESGRGYPNIDSLKEIARFFSVTIDALIRPEEVVTAAETEKKDWVRRYLSLLCGALDVFSAVLLFLPAFGNGAASHDTVALFQVSGVSPWLKITFMAVIGLTVLNGIGGVTVSFLERPDWNRRLRRLGTALSIGACALFLAARQPYPGLFCFAALLVKGFLIIRVKP